MVELRVVENSTSHQTSTLELDSTTGTEARAATTTALALDAPVTRVCSECHAEKPLSEFGKNGSGYRGQCKTCCWVQIAAHRAANPKKVKARTAAWRAADRAANPLRNTWNGLKGRCTNPNNSKYQDYGGRGITVCDRWLGGGGFSNFAADMGERPSSKHSLDRINVDGNYEPRNCRWATAVEQMANRRLKMFVNEAIAIVTELSGAEVAARFAAIRHYNALPVATPAMIAQAKSGEATWSWEWIADELTA